MHLQILKKDLKRKKTMNIILLMFIMLSAMFVSSSVNNILTVTTALDSFFEKAEMPDYFVASKNNEYVPDIDEELKKISEIESFSSEKIVYGSPENFTVNGDELQNNKNTSVIMSFDDAAINYFDVDDSIIENVEEGTVVLSAKIAQASNIKNGDILKIEINGVSAEFEIAGSCKDAVLGSNMMGMGRFILNENDFSKFYENEEIKTMFGGALCYITTDNIPAVETALTDINSIIFNGDKAMIKMSYVMDMIIAGVLLVVSVCLILIAFVVLRFTIAFTLSEEYREIGVMKAIGIKNFKIRSIYLIKYSALSVVGAAAGFLLSIPFGNMLLAAVSKSMVLENKNSVFINLICAAIVTVVILIFSYGCTRKIKKFTPVDAIRSGTTGERFKKKGILRLSKSPLKPSLFMAANDVISSPKRFGIIILALTISLSLILVLVNTVNTLESDNLITTFGMAKSDVCYVSETEQTSFLTSGGQEKAEEKLLEIEEELSENGMPSDCFMEVSFKMNLSYKDRKCKSLSLIGINTTTDMYEYFEGTAPQHVNEIAVTEMIAQKLDAQIGDVITVGIGEENNEYIITALYQSMNNMGEGVRFHQDVELDFAYAGGFFAYQIDFTDNPSDRVINDRIEKIKKLFDSDDVMTSGEYIGEMAGVTSTLDSVRMLSLCVVIIVIALVTVLIERSFIAKERSEIAILKAVGFTNGSVVKWHTGRFAIASVIAVIISLILTVPITSLTITPIFNMMGATYGVSYEINPLEVFVIYPLAVLAVTVISAFFTSLYTRKIKASEASSIE